MQINFGRPPSKKEKGQYNRWVKYLKDSKLSNEEIHKRASQFVNQNMKVPK